MCDHTDFPLVIPVLIGHIKKSLIHLVNNALLDRLLVLCIQVLNNVRRRHIEYLASMVIWYLAFAHPFADVRLINHRLPINNHCLKCEFTVDVAAFNQLTHRFFKIRQVLVLSLRVGADTVHDQDQVGLSFYRVLHNLKNLLAMAALIVFNCVFKRVKRYKLVRALVLSERIRFETAAELFWLKL